MSHKCDLHCKHLPEDFHTDLIAKSMQDELDKEFITEMTQELGMYLVPVKRHKVTQVMHLPKRNLTSMMVEHAFVSPLRSTAD